MRLEQKGIPAVLVSHDIFEKAAHVQAQVMGLPAMKVVVVSYPKPGEDKEGTRRRAESILEEIANSLVAHP
ncbi:MAG: hypothetical protein Q8O76_12195 [Chloroflexota bacterium]|nr:hypothetical protein [Chloroflexota bacterium]